jgi:hypothetical protein
VNGGRTGVLVEGMCVARLEFLGCIGCWQCFPVYGFCVSSFVSFLRFLVCLFSCFISQKRIQILFRSQCMQLLLTRR